MRRTLSIGAGAGAAALALTLAAGVASATSGTHQQAGGAAIASVSKHITRAQAERIAEAKVPHSKAIEVQSDDLHDRAVWKVTLKTPHERVIVDVDKRTGKATIVRRSGGGGHDGSVLAGSLSTGTSGRDGRDDRGRLHGEHRDRDGRHHDRHHHDRGDDNGRR
jgi:peptidase YpeB-like protein